MLKDVQHQGRLQRHLPHPHRRQLQAKKGYQDKKSRPWSTWTFQHCQGEKKLARCRKEVFAQTAETNSTQTQTSVKPKATGVKFVILKITLNQHALGTMIIHTHIEFRV